MRPRPSHCQGGKRIGEACHEDQGSQENADNLISPQRLIIDQAQLRLRINLVLCLGSDIGNPTEMQMCEVNSSKCRAVPKSAGSAMSRCMRYAARVKRVIAILPLFLGTADSRKHQLKWLGPVFRLMRS